MLRASPVLTSALLHLLLAGGAWSVWNRAPQPQPAPVAGPRWVSLVTRPAPASPAQPPALAARPARTSRSGTYAVARPTPTAAAAVHRAQARRSAQGPAHAPGARPSELASYVATLRLQVGAGLRYPRELKDRGVAGQVLVRLVVDARGELRELALKQPSGHRQLDELALGAVREAAPFPKPPTANVALTLPIRFY